MRNILVIAVISLGLLAFQSDSGLRFAARGESLTTDPLGNIYVYDSMHLTVYSPIGKYLARYSAMEEHRISHVDASNPFKIILFDQEDQIMLYLDNTLNPVQDGTTLRDFGIGRAISVCSSSDNGFWVYDEYFRELRHFDKYLNEVSSSTLTTNLKSTNDVWMQEYGFGVVLYFHSSGLLLCDKYGTELHFVDLPKLKSPCIESGSFYAISEARLAKVDLNSLKVTWKDLNLDSVKAIAFERGRMIALQHDTVMRLKAAE